VVTIEVTIEDSLLAKVQQASNFLQITPSDFIKVALERAVQQRGIIAKERRDAQGYAEQPQQAEAIKE
jgi:antitoxin component of RelBE/YafQ-DinJ toxin-antitoxin module